MGVSKTEAYDFSAQIRGVDGAPVLRLQLYGGDGTLLDSVGLTNFSSGWKKYTATLHPKDTDPTARLAVVLDGKGIVDIDMVSLFPRHTWKNRPGGLRADMVQALADMKPGFLRFPGGCIVEGSVLNLRYQWKKTIGPVEERPLLINRWNTEFVHRPTPDYYQSFGLGFYEYFQLCEDIGAQPLPILNCGMACQFNSGELCPLDDLGPYIQDALDLIEFANGPATSTWGAKRAAMGHPAPFNLKMLGVGNEQWGQQYIDRYTLFAKALKAKYPEIQLVSAAGPSPDDSRFKFAWPKLRELHADIVDEHCYDKPDWFFNNTHRYDNYDRNGPKVFMGEYAAQSDAVVSVKNRNNLECALAEAAYMTGLERNARRGPHGELRAALRQLRSLAMDAGLDLGGQPDILSHAQLLCAAALQPQSWRRGAAHETGGGIRRKTIRLRHSRQRQRRSHPQSCQWGQHTRHRANESGGRHGENFLQRAKITVLAGEPNDENSFADAAKDFAQRSGFGHFRPAISARISGKFVQCRG